MGLTHRHAPKPPCPEPGAYVWVVTKEGSYWRKKRKPSGLNHAFREGAERMQISAPAARRIMGRLHEYLRTLQHGRLNSRISAMMRKTLKEKGRLDFSLFSDMEIQPNYRLSAILKAYPQSIIADGLLKVEIPIHPDTSAPLTNQVNDYYFELILLSGDPGREDGLRLDVETSVLYSIRADLEHPCLLGVFLPETPWVAFLKMSFQEKDQPALHCRHYGMRVVAVGGSYEKIISS